VVYLSRCIFGGKWIHDREGGNEMESKVKHHPDENRENDFIDFIVAVVVSTGILIGIFVVATMLEFI
jgi:hypothetical protein